MKVVAIGREQWPVSAESRRRQPADSRGQGARIPFSDRLCKHPSVELWRSIVLLSYPLPAKSLQHPTPSYDLLQDIQPLGAGINAGFLISVQNHLLVTTPKCPFDPLTMAPGIRLGMRHLSLMALGILEACPNVSRTTQKYKSGDFT